MASWILRVPPPTALVTPVPVDPAGKNGPTPGAARGRFWRRTSPGLYVPGTVDRSVVEQRILEESCRLPAGGAVTGWAALRLHGVGYLDGLGADGRTPLPVALVVPPGTRLRSVAGIVAHRERLAPNETTLRHGVRITTSERASFDASRRAPDLREAVAILDLALASGVLRRVDLRNTLARKVGWQGLRQAARALQLADERSMSPKETALRMIWLLDAGLPTPRCNWPVADAHGTFIGRPDLLCAELAVVGEFDGAEHRGRERHRDDLRRDDLFRSVGLEPFRVVGADLRDTALVIERARAAIQRSAVSTTPKSWSLATNPRPVS